MKLKNRVAIITGSSRGIGRATAIAMDKEGAKVVVCYLKEREKAEKVVSQLTDAIAIQVDVTNENSVESLVREVVNKYGGIDILVNNAGAIKHRVMINGSMTEFQEMLTINLVSLWLVSKHVVPYLKKSKNNPSIINITSVYGMTGAPILAYTSAKGGVITLTKSLAKELAPHIRVNAVAPSNVQTDMTASAGKELIEYFREQTPLKRLAEPKELAKPIAFLASDDASYITGEVLVVDGGFNIK